LTVITYIFLGPLCALAVTADKNLMITGGKDRKVIVWEYHNHWYSITNNYYQCV